MNIMDSIDECTISYPKTMYALKESMLSGEQSPGVNYFLHGEEVADKFTTLMALAKDGKASCKMIDATGAHWRLPNWFVDNQKWIYSKLEPKFDIYRTYHIWHDCGKSLVKKFDSNSAQAHYPDHAEVSANAWIAAGGDEGVASLIRSDMLCHRLRRANEAKLHATTNPDFLVLMVTTLCALHVYLPTLKDGEERPSDLTTSEGFKIKFKRMQYIGNMMMQILNKTK